MALAWLVAYKKVNTNDMLQLRRSFKALSPDWCILYRRSSDMMVISFKCFANSIRGGTLWRIAYLSLLWIVWKERNTRIFKDAWKTPKLMWDSL